jgi:hypothetical protein
VFGKRLAVAERVKELSLWIKSKTLEQHCQVSLPVRVLATEASAFPLQSPRSDRIVRSRVPILPPPDTATRMYAALPRRMNKS